MVCTTEERCRYVRVSELFVYEKFSRVAAEAVEAGDICAVCGIDDIQIGETIADKISEKPLPAIKVEEPTVKMAFSINTSPFVGRELISISSLWSGIDSLLFSMFALRENTFIISGRGTLHITILTENITNSFCGMRIFKSFLPFAYSSPSFHAAVCFKDDDTSFRRY
ncbi:hypothetical protein TEA_016053 [Camellia sinensis var. sinensis]|uniref:Translation elongation factor EFTu-like domain-containing protein n=1 Tax=Camellia sinensis var. sinensis TaxID=542762 RepID=A0A4S4DBJ8_CAMSN|nr:hypothetical protein TEA_016053 [Camellia sinensis var. sinensis]